jgi:predicted HTH transcriptional regulator
MKIKDLQKLVLPKYENGDSATKTFHDLLGVISRKTSFNRCKMIHETGSIGTCTSPGRRQTIRTKETMQKVKNRLKRKKRVSSRKLAQELDISRTSVHRVLAKGLRLRPY